jgi:hypothetical protein
MILSRNCAAVNQRRLAGRLDRGPVDAALLHVEPPLLTGVPLITCPTCEVLMLLLTAPNSATAERGVRRSAA